MTVSPWAWHAAMSPVAREAASMRTTIRTLLVLATPLWLSLRRDRCFVFPCRVQSRLADPYVRPGASAAAE